MAIRWQDLKPRSGPERGEDRARAQAAPRRKRAASGETAAQRRERSAALEEKYPRWETVVARVIPAKRRAEIKRRIRAEVAAWRGMTGTKALRIVERLAFENERLTAEERAALGFVLRLMDEGASSPLAATPNRRRSKASAPRRTGERTRARRSRRGSSLLARSRPRWYRMYFGHRWLGG